MGDANHSAGYGTRELMANLEKCINKNVLDAHYRILQQLEGT